MTSLVYNVKPKFNKDQTNCFGHGTFSWTASYNEPINSYTGSKINTYINLIHYYERKLGGYFSYGKMSLNGSIKVNSVDYAVVYQDYHLTLTDPDGKSTEGAYLPLILHELTGDVDNAKFEYSDMEVKFEASLDDVVVAAKKSTTTTAIDDVKSSSSSSCPGIDLFSNSDSSS